MKDLESLLDFKSDKEKEQLSNYLKNLKMQKQNFTREDVENVIQSLLDRPDVLIDAIQNENSEYGSKELLELTESD